jgi:hypothetical protein
MLLIAVAILSLVTSKSIPSNSIMMLEASMGDEFAHFFAPDAAGRCTRLVLGAWPITDGRIEHTRMPTDVCGPGMAWPDQVVSLGVYQCSERRPGAMNHLFILGDRSDGCTRERTSTVSIAQQPAADEPKLTWLSATSPSCHTEFELALPSADREGLPTGDFYNHNRTTGICTRMTLRDDLQISAFVERSRLPLDPDESCDASSLRADAMLLGETYAETWPVDDILSLRDGEAGDGCVEERSAQVQIIGAGGSARDLAELIGAVPALQQGAVQAEAAPELVVASAGAGCHTNLELRVPNALLRDGSDRLARRDEDWRCQDRDRLILRYSGQETGSERNPRPSKRFAAGTDDDEDTLLDVLLDARRMPVDDWPTFQDFATVVWRAHVLGEIEESSDHWLWHVPIPDWLEALAIKWNSSPQPPGIEAPLALFDDPTLLPSGAPAKPPSGHRHYVCVAALSVQLLSVLLLCSAVAAALLALWTCAQKAMQHGAAAAEACKLMV